MKVRTLAISILALALAGCSGEDRITGPTGWPRPTLLNAIGTDPVTGATIETNQDDYAPGEVVHLVGHGWAAGETVHLFMTEEPDTHGDVSMDVQADSTGSFTLHFYDVQLHDLGVTFTLTATGQSSGSQAVAIFTDGRVVTDVTIDGEDPGATLNVLTNQSLSFVVEGSTNTLSGTGNSKWVSTSVAFIPSPSGTAETPCNDNDVYTVANVGASGLSTSFAVEAPDAPGTYSVQVRAHQDDGCSSGQQSAQFPGLPPALQFTLVVTAPPSNAAPTADAGGPYDGAEGSAIQLNGTGSSDSDGTVVAYAWDYAVVSAGAGTTCSFDDATLDKPKITCNDNGTFTVKLVVTDDDGATSAEATAALTVTNVPPSITSVTLSPLAAGNIYPITQAVTVTAAFTDPGTLDTHTCATQAIALNVAPVNAGPANAASGSCANTLSFLEAGVYAVTITVTDKDGDSDSETVQVIVYDPSAGFVTGGGWIDSPAGAYSADPELTGKATFGFVAKYKKGASVPEGNTQFVFHAGGFNFNSAAYDFLIVNQNGTNAQYKGTGTVNGASGYTFMLWAKDGATDELRIKIWVTATNAVVYDNLLGGADGEVQAITNGSIVIHAPKK